MHTEPNDTVVIIDEDLHEVTTETGKVYYLAFFEGKYLGSCASINEARAKTAAAKDRKRQDRNGPK